MKKHPLDIAILICLIIIIVLLVILIWPVSNNSKKSNKEQKEISKVDFEIKEEEVVSYICEVEQEVENLSRKQNNSSSVKEKLENTFIMLTDFIFYGGSIKGVTFYELSDMAKEKVLTLYEKVDSSIESRFPNYKENIKSTAKKGYTTVVSKARDLKDNIISKYKEKVSEEQYNNVVDGFTEDKNRFQDAYQPYIEKGKEIGSKAVDKGKEVINSTIEKLDTWYKGFKESRE